MSKETAAAAVEVHSAVHASQQRMVTAEAEKANALAVATYKITHEVGASVTSVTYVTCAACVTCDLQDHSRGGR